MRPIEIFTRLDFERAVLPGEQQKPGVEGIHLDFKRERNSLKSRDLAVDIAAFANSQGGVLVVGVAEDPDRPGVAGQLHPIDVAETIDGIESALNRWTFGFDVRPRPLRLVVDDSGADVVVVNVDPSPRLVSVRSDSGKPEICYPFRTTHGNAWLKPEEVEQRISGRHDLVHRAALRQALRKNSGSSECLHLRLLSIDHANRQASSGRAPSLIEFPQEGNPPPIVPRIVSLTSTGISLTFEKLGGKQKLPLEIPSEWVLSVWHDSAVFDDGARRPILAMFVECHIALDFDKQTSRATPSRWR